MSPLQASTHPSEKQGYEQPTGGDIVGNAGNHSFDSTALKFFVNPRALGKHHIITATSGTHLPGLYPVARL